MLGYLGPAGTFTHQALTNLIASTPFSDEQLLAFPSVGQALAALRAGQLRACLVPIENSVEGGVSATLDNIGDLSDPLQIVAETVLPIRFDLCARKGVNLNQIDAVISHPHAIAQVRNWLDKNLPNARVRQVGSTAVGAATVAKPDSGNSATVCSSIAAKLFDLRPLVSGLADNQSASTRFVLVSKIGSCPERTGHDKTTLVAYMRQDQPGALLAILQQFATRGVNLCRIESRPTKTSLGSYCFSIDAEGHIADARMADALVGLKRICKDVIFLGSYARADAKSSIIQYGGRDEDYRDAISWVRQIGAKLY